MDEIKVRGLSTRPITLIGLGREVNDFRRNPGVMEKGSRD